MSQIYVLHYIYGVALINNTRIYKLRATLFKNYKYKICSYFWILFCHNEQYTPPSLQMIHIELLTKINQLLISYK